MAHDVFISHSSKDKTTADAVCAMLESNGIRCWIAPRDVTPAMEWGACIIEAIKECRIMILVFTNHANESPQIRREVERAINHGVMILPLRIEDIVPSTALEYFIGNLHWLDAITPPLENHLQGLAATVKILIARMPPREQQPFPPPVPPVMEPPWQTVEAHKETPASARERKERALDAAMSRTVPVGRATQVLAMVREADSQGLRHILEIEEDYSVAPEDVRSRHIEIEFPVDSDGNRLPAEFNLRLESPDFEPRSQVKRLVVPVSGDSDVCSFLVTAQRAGELLLNLEILTKESSIATRTFKTTAQANLPDEVSAGQRVIVSVPLYTSASTWSTPVFAGSGSSSGSAYVSSASSPSVPMATPPTQSANPFTRKRVALGAMVAVVLLSVGSLTYQKWGTADSGVAQEAPPQSATTSVAQPAVSQPVGAGSETAQPTEAAEDYFPDAPMEASRLSIFTAINPDAKYVSARRASCDAGNAAGCSDLAYLYDTGMVLTQDKARALQFYQKACDGGDADGCTNLGYLYAEGEGVAKDEARAVPLFQKGCDGGEVFACYDLAYAYGRGRGALRDSNRAVVFMQKACDLGNTQECTEIRKLHTDLDK